MALGDYFDYFSVFVFVNSVLSEIILYNCKKMCFYSNGPNGAVSLMRTYHVRMIFHSVYYDIRVGQKRSLK